jgi:hypothetical protein
MWGGMVAIVSVEKPQGSSLLVLSTMQYMEDGR